MLTRLETAVSCTEILGMGRILSTGYYDRIAPLQLESHGRSWKLKLGKRQEWIGSSCENTHITLYHRTYSGTIGRMTPRDAGDHQQQRWQSRLIMPPSGSVRQPFIVRDVDIYRMRQRAQILHMYVWPTRCAILRGGQYQQC